MSGALNPLTPSELADLKAEALHWHRGFDHETTMRLIDMVERQREAFRTYACHTDGCFSPGVRCTCGFDEALAAMVPQK